MFSKNTEKIYITIAAFFTVFLINYVFFLHAWNSPTAAPTGGNIELLNVGSATQFKTGALGLGGNSKSSGIKINSGGATEPTCNVNTRGLFWSKSGGVSEEDELIVCLKNSDDEYAWESVGWTEDCSVKSIGSECGGGKVAYLDGVGGGLIAASADNSTGVEWGCQGTFINVLSTAIGTGASNTSAVLSGCATRPIAASVCDSYDGGGYEDWFLPSIDELYELYKNRLAIQGFSSSGTYWSSSEYDGLNALIAEFAYDFQGSMIKSYDSIRVRCVRSF